MAKRCRGTWEARERPQEGMNGLGARWRLKTGSGGLHVARRTLVASIRAPAQREPHALGAHRRPNVLANSQLALRPALLRQRPRTAQQWARRWQGRCVLPLDRRTELTAAPVSLNRREGIRRTSHSALW